LQCPKCGAEIPENSASCNACGQSLANSAGEHDDLEPGVIRRRAIYAGFWFRALAFAVDSLILGAAVGFTILKPILDSNHVGTSWQDVLKFYSSGSRQATALGCLLQLIVWLYYASFESSPWQGTPGKKILGLVVTDLEGKRISFLRATGRSFGKIISQFTFLIGFFMAGVTAKKQALHDMIAGCLVLRKI
jgi:uncharacterized RDD family membrane protein YckC